MEEYIIKNIFYEACPEWDDKIISFLNENYISIYGNKIIFNKELLRIIIGSKENVAVMLCEGDNIKSFIVGCFEYKKKYELELKTKKNGLITYKYTQPDIIMDTIVLHLICGENKNIVINTLYIYLIMNNIKYDEVIYETSINDIDEGYFIKCEKNDKIYCRAVNLPKLTLKGILPMYVNTTIYKKIYGSFNYYTNFLKDHYFFISYNNHIEKRNCDENVYDFLKYLMMINTNKSDCLIEFNFINKKTLTTHCIKLLILTTSSNIKMGIYYENTCRNDKLNESMIELISEYCQSKCLCDVIYTRNLFNNESVYKRTKMIRCNGDINSYLLFSKFSLSCKTEFSKI